MDRLSDDLRREVDALFAAGEAAIEDDDYDDAVEIWWEAVGLLPDPKTRHEEAGRLLAAIGDAEFVCGEWAAGRDALELALRCPGGAENALVHLRLGQCLLELDDGERAVAHLARAHALGGDELFEDEDGKYLAFLIERGPPPPGGW